MLALGVLEVNKEKTLRSVSGAFFADDIAEVHVSVTRSERK